MIALEDKRFLKHSGFDHVASVRAFTNFFIGSAHGGGSTIDMQLYRIFTNQRELTTSRKFKEIIGARELNRRFSKHQIIWFYTELCFISTKYFSVRSAYTPFQEAFGERFPDIDRFFGCLPKYPAPRQPSTEWLEKVQRRYDYAEERLPIQKQALAELRGDQ